jgi:hypothetical protein
LLSSISRSSGSLGSDSVPMKLFIRAVSYDAYDLPMETESGHALA